jgi:hypothetical protein
MGFYKRERMIIMLSNLAEFLQKKSSLKQLIVYKNDAGMDFYTGSGETEVFKKTKVIVNFWVQEFFDGRIFFRVWSRNKDACLFFTNECTIRLSEIIGRTDNFYKDTKDSADFIKIVGWDVK